jgi:hypothetical protein
MIMTQNPVVILVADENNGTSPRSLTDDLVFGSPVRFLEPVLGNSRQAFRVVQDDAVLFPSECRFYHHGKYYH